MAANAQRGFASGSAARGKSGFEVDFAQGVCATAIEAASQKAKNGRQGECPCRRPSLGCLEGVAV
jgi:hypothetical protein